MRLALRRQMKALRAAILLAPLVAANGCLDSLEPQQATTLFVYAGFAEPNVLVTLNGNALGTLVNEFTGSEDCLNLFNAVGSGAVLATTVRLGEHYTIAWDYGGENGTGGDEFDATEDAVAASCLLEKIGPP